MIAEKEHSDHYDLLVRAAWYYHKLDLTQKEVGNRLNISRQMVQRLLKEGREKGIIRVEINSPISSLLSVEETLEEQYSLDKAIVVPSHASGEELRSSLGKASARFMSRLINEKLDVIGTGWGKTLRSFVDHFQAKPIEDADVVSLIGNLLGDTAFNPYSIADTLARKLSANCYNVWAPAIVKDQGRANLFKSEPWIKKTLDKAATADLIVVSIGELSRESTLAELGYLTSEDIRELREKKAVGDILGSFFDVEGNLVNSEIHERLIALTVDRLKDNGKVLGVSGGEKKVKAIEGALKGDMLDVLITDEYVADGLTE